MSSKQPLVKVQHWLGGKKIASGAEHSIESCNPLDDSPYCEIPMATEVTIDAAVQAAHQAFQTFRHNPVSDRERWLMKAADVMEERCESLSAALIDEIGSPITKANREVASAAKILRAAAGATRHVTGKTYPSDIPGRLSLSTRTPLGVVAGITPFNVPLIKMVKHSAMPLATGNTVVLLPSLEAPLVAEMLAEIYQEAGIPAGAFNLVFGSGIEIGDRLTSHSLVKFVGFTGSHRVGQQVAKVCGEHRKRVTLELGGKNPLVVLQDANLKQAIQGCVLGSFFFQGQICMSSSRIYVQEEIFASFTESLINAVHNIRCSDLLDPRTMIGPIINAKQRQRIKAHLDDAIEKGAQILTGNEWDHNVLFPTVLADVNPSMTIHTEETFGPVTCLYKVQSAEEALERANATDFGLCGAIFTNQLDKALEYAQRLNAGMVHINGSTIQEEPHVPFGGTGQSGFGREGTDVSIDDLTEWKWVTIRSN